MKAYAKRSVPAVRRRGQNAPELPSGTIANSALLELLGEGSEPVEAGMPSGLRRRMEALTGVSLAGVEVRKDSVEAENLSTPAFTDGNTVYLAHGQERELPHELGHIADRRLGSTPDACTGHGVKISRDASGEARADRIAQLAAQTSPSSAPPALPSQSPAPPTEGVIQMCPHSAPAQQASSRSPYSTRDHPYVDYSQMDDGRDDPKDASYSLSNRHMYFKEVPRKEREELLAHYMKTSGRCQYEGCEYPTTPLQTGPDADPRFKASLDHKTPVSEIFNRHQGKISREDLSKEANDPSNIQFMHACCNSKKGGVRYKPRDPWS